MTALYKCTIDIHIDIIKFDELSILLGSLPNISPRVSVSPSCPPGITPGAELNLGFKLKRELNWKSN